MSAGKIVAGAVGEDKLATDAVIAVKIKDGEVTAGKIAAGAVGEDQLQTDAVIAVKTKDGEVTNDKLAGGINYAKLDAATIPAITSLTGLTNVESSLYSAPAMANLNKPNEIGGYILVGAAIGTTQPGRPFVLWRDASGYVRIS